MVITLDLYGPSNQMMMLFCRDTNLDNTVLYVVNNASCYAKAVEAIAINEDLFSEVVDAVVYQQNSKKFKHKFLKSQGYKMLSALTLAQLNEKIIAHFGME